MPNAARKPCRMPGCPNLTDPVQRYCPTHRGAGERIRGTASDRGYDTAYTRLRTWFMSRPENQLCRTCYARGVITLATDCDHVIPFRGVDDPKRLDPMNLQPLCATCHRAKTAGGIANV